MNVGATAFTVMLYFPHSTARHLVRCAMAAFVMQYTDSVGSAANPAWELMLMMRPLFCRIMTRPAAWLAKKGPLQIDGQGQIEILFAHIFRQIVGRESGIVDQDVEPSEMPDGVIDGLKYLIEPGHVHLQGKRAAAHRLDLRHQISLRIHITQAKCYVRAGVGQSACDRIAQTARRPGDKRHLTGKTKVRKNRSRCLQKSLPLHHSSDDAVYSQPQPTQKARRKGLQVVHALGNEALAVAIVQQAIVGQGATGQRINRRVADHDTQLIPSRFQQRCYIDGVRRMPHHACTLAVHVHFRRFPYRSLQVGPQVEGRQRIRLGHRLAFSEIQDQRTCRAHVSRQLDGFFVDDLSGIVFERFLLAPGVKSSHVSGLIQSVEPEVPIAGEIDDRRMRVLTTRAPQA